jgi:hypothetical protein
MKRAALLLAALSCGSCVATSDAMAPLGRRVPQAPRPGYATVVFVRPSGYAGSVLFSVLSDRYGFLGESSAESWFAAELPAGPQVFCAKADNTSALRASLLPGKRYYVEVSSRMSFWTAGVQLLAISPRSPNWANRELWLADTDGYALLDRNAMDPSDAADIIDDCHQRLADYDAAELEERTLYAADGL